MDLLAAVALVFVLEGLALAIFARSIPAMLAELERMDPRMLRRAGITSVALGAALYVFIRGLAAG